MMQLKTNIKTNLIFFRRNKLFIVLSICLLVIFALSTLPAITMISSTKKFDIIKRIFESINGFGGFIIIVIALTALWSHIKDRNIKMVITKPCSIESYLLSMILSGGIVCLLIFFIAACVFVALSLIWSIPLQTGMYFILFDNIFGTFALFTIFVCLSIIFHPGIAVIVALFFNQGTFYHFALWSETSQDVGGQFLKLFLKIFNRIIYFIYLAVPDMSPFENVKNKVSMSYKISSNDIKYFLYSYGYYILLALFFYFLAVFFIKRKRLI